MLYFIALHYAICTSWSCQYLEISHMEVLTLWKSANTTNRAGVFFGFGFVFVLPENNLLNIYQHIRESNIKGWS